ncbi:hypothetical protein PC128_g17765 [Phytophthora cactorum]|nr:hypothetical protein PC128_g17765 [Phytophthora cactorum]
MQHDQSTAKDNLPDDGEDFICLYPSKRCENPRALKANDQLHKFCQFHRDKANFNQRHLEFKRRLQHQPAGVQNNVLDEEDFEPDEEDIQLIEEVAAASLVASNL